MGSLFFCGDISSYLTSLPGIHYIPVWSFFYQLLQSQHFMSRFITFGKSESWSLSDSTFWTSPAVSPQPGCYYSPVMWFLEKCNQRKNSALNDLLFCQCHGAFVRSAPQSWTCPSQSTFLFCSHYLHTWFHSLQISNYLTEASRQWPRTKIWSGIWGSALGWGPPTYDVSTGWGTELQNIFHKMKRVNEYLPRTVESVTEYLISITKKSGCRFYSSELMRDTQATVFDSAVDWSTF